MNFPLFIDLKDKKVLIVGAGAIAARRATVLVEFGAKVTVMAPEAGSGVQVNHAAELKSFTAVGDSVLEQYAQTNAPQVKNLLGNAEQFRCGNLRKRGVWFGSVTRFASRI